MRQAVVVRNPCTRAVRLASLVHTKATQLGRSALHLGSIDPPYKGLVSIPRRESRHLHTAIIEPFYTSSQFNHYAATKKTWPRTKAEIS